MEKTRLFWGVYIGSAYHVTSFPCEAEIMDASRVQPIKLARVGMVLNNA